MVKLSQLTNPSFQVALSSLSAQEIPMKAAYKFKSILKRLAEELKKYDELRTELLNKYGDKDSAGELVVDEKNTVKFSEENLKLFGQKLTELLDTEVDIGHLKVDDLGDKVSLSVRDVSLLDSFLIT